VLVAFTRVGTHDSDSVRHSVHSLVTVSNLLEMYTLQYINSYSFDVLKASQTSHLPHAHAGFGQQFITETNIMYNTVYRSIVILHAEDIATSQLSHARFGEQFFIYIYTGY
jgi:hypothetical protein